MKSKFMFFTFLTAVLVSILCFSCKDPVRKLTFEEIIYGPMANKMVRNGLVTAAEMKSLGAEVNSDTNFLCIWYWSSYKPAQDFCYRAAKLNGINVLSTYAVGRYWQALKGAGRSLAALEQVANAIEDVEKEGVKLTLTPEQIKELSTLDDQKKEEIRKAKVYRKITKIARAKTAGNTAALILNGVALMRDKAVLIRPTVIRAVKTSVKNLKASKKNRPALKRNNKILELVEKAIADAGIDIFGENKKK